MSATKPPFPSPAIAAAFAAFPDAVRPQLLRARELIFETAHHTAGVGRIEETLKWGQPAYLTPETSSGSTIRLGIPKSPSDGWALFVHCQTSLIRQFREHYPDRFTFEGNRALLFRPDEVIPEDALSHCIALALTYHQKRA